MRALFILVFVAFSMGAMATFERSGTTPETSVARSVNAPAGTLSGAVAVVRKARRAEQGWSDPPAGSRDSPRLAVGDVLPKGTALYSVPGHESYRYAIVQGQRAIVDAASRQVVYIIQ
jgi:hypothetical protein